MRLAVLALIPSLAIAQQQQRVSDVVAPLPPDVIKIEPKQWPVEWGGRTRDPHVGPNGLVYFVGQTGNYVASLDQKTGAMRKFELDTTANPHTVIVDSEGVLWYAGNVSAHIGRIDPTTGAITKFRMPNGQPRDPHTMIDDGKGNIWFTAQQSQFVGRLNKASGKIDLVQLPPQSNPYGIILDKEGRPVFDMFRTNKIGMVDPATMTLKTYDLPDPAARPRRIAMTGDGMIWYTDYARGYIGRLDPRTGAVKEWASPGGPQSGPYALNVDDKDRLWYTETRGTTRRIYGFDARQEKIFASVELDPRGGTIRHMMFDPKTREMWFGTDGNTVGKIVVP